MALGKRVKEIREIRGLTQDQLAKRVGMTQGAIHNLEKRDSRGTRYIMEIAKALSVSPEWLRSGTGLRDSEPVTTPLKSNFGGNLVQDHEMSELEPMEVWDSKTPLSDDDIELPLFREIELSAGSGRTQVIENHGAKLKFAKSSLTRAGVSKEHAACAYVSGDSMEPVLPDGSTVGVDTSDKRIRDGKLYALDQDGMLRVKQLYRIPQGIRLRSFNTSHHDEDYDLDYAEHHIRIIGRVFWYASFI